MSTTTNLGRVQGGGLYYSRSTSTTSILKNTLVSTSITPLVDDIIINANGDICSIIAITETAYTVTQEGNIKGPRGDDGDNGEPGATWTAGTQTPDNTSGTDGDFFLNTSNWDIYKKSNGMWDKVGNIKGKDADTTQYYTKQETDVAISEAIDNAITKVLNTPV